MAGITLAQAEEKLSTWMGAEDKVANGQSYSIGTRSLTRADLSDIRDSIKYWNDMVSNLSRGGKRIRQIVPVSN